MNILWVEDNPENKQNFWFASRNVRNITDFSEAEETIEKELNSYDVVVLDIDLRNSDPEKVREKSNQFGLSPDIFLQKSGMVLFLILLERGFPREQIIFLTGNADKNNLSILVDTISSSKDVEQIKNTTEKILDCLSDEQKTELKQKSNKEDKINYIKNLAIEKRTSTYDIFCDAYKAICIKPPRAISKSNDKDAQLELRSWLEDHEKNNYLVLRRGIIEGCDFLKIHIEKDKDDDNIQFREFIKIENNQPTIEIPTKDIKNYLDAVSQLLAIKEPIEQNIQYRLFLRTLVHEWEENIDPKSLKEKYPQFFRKDQPNSFGKMNDIYTFAWLMKMTRNRVSHANLLEPLNSQIIAFLFLINMRAMFKLPKAIQPYEKILLRCISLSPVQAINSQELNGRITDALKNVNDILAGLNLNESGHFGEKINAIYRHNTRNPDAKEHNFKSFLLQYFWVNQKSELRKLSANSDEFLPTLARHIYGHSFL
jgi:hypothetical protein